MSKISIKQWLFLALTIKKAPVYGKWFVMDETGEFITCEYTGNTYEVIKYMDKDGKWQNHMNREDYFDTYEEALATYEKHHGKFPMS